ncbi:MAG: nicotinate-nucleotide adenylyltransferase [Dehalococcoidia bacterium]|nr:nicotinate-nucleotide adenylyltransferase [Dehalococcoidia bacterium]
MRLGVLGGTFDPIHVGHLVIAEEARLQLSLDKVLFIPTGHPYLRQSQPISGHHRLAMVRLAIQDNPAFEASSLELERPGPTYALDTLRELQRQHSGAAELFFIMGQDSLHDVPRWHRPAEMLTLCTIVVAPRPGAPALTAEDVRLMLPSPAERLPEARGAGGTSSQARVELLRSPLISISATELRRRAAAGLSLRYWVPRAVEAYINQHHLHQADAKPGGPL